jgi:hypothetical protein
MGMKFQQNPDPVMRAVFEESGLKKRMQKIAKSDRIQWPVNKIEEIEKYKAREKKWN